MAKKPTRSTPPADGDKGRVFDPRTLDRALVATPLLEWMEVHLDPHPTQEATRKARRKYSESGRSASEPLPIIIDVNLDHPAGRDAAQDGIRDWLRANVTPPEALDEFKTELMQQYVFAEVFPATIWRLIEADKRGLLVPVDSKGSSARAMFRVWPDFAVESHTTKSWSTVKADAAHRSFSALGGDIVWAVIDSGIDATHEHFQLHQNLELPKPLEHIDFTKSPGGATVDGFGHGTHVAGIIAGENARDLKDLKGAPLGQKLNVATHRRNDRERDGPPIVETSSIDAIRGMAPKCKLLSLKALDGDGKGRVSNIVAALATIQKVNSHGRRIRVHGVNLSVGYSFDAEWFACGQSPLCVEVDRLVKSGVCVVVAAGNTGYGDVETDARGLIKTPMALSINDPGNAELAITVGATHREMPHVYGVSYFSSKGPTGDGRSKPDLVAPGEKIVSCAAGGKLAKAQGELAKKAGAKAIGYVEDSGTSMAAPHVSGVIAAFLSVRKEFIGRPEDVKRIFTESATDLKRERYFQGHGLVDLMRAIQSV